MTEYFSDLLLNLDVNARLKTESRQNQAKESSVVSIYMKSVWSCVQFALLDAFNNTASQLTISDLLTVFTHHTEIASNDQMISLFANAKNLFVAIFDSQMKTGASSLNDENFQSIVQTSIEHMWQAVVDSYRSPSFSKLFSLFVDAGSTSGFGSDLTSGSDLISGSDSTSGFGLTATLAFGFSFNLLSCFISGSACSSISNFAGLTTDGLSVSTSGSTSGFVFAKLILLLLVIGILRYLLVRETLLATTRPTLPN